jgi:hypothetical protein
MASENAYPVRVTFDYPEALDRTTTALRVFMWLPVAIMADLLAGGVNFGGNTAMGAGGGLFLAIGLIILFRGYIPRWVFDFQVALIQFGTRGVAYLALLTDQYPAFEAPYPVNVTVDYPEAPTRWKVIVWKIITAIPHLIALFVLMVVAVVVAIVAWFAILFTGRYPRGMFDFVSGVIRWGVRVQAYVTSLTDVYPPFSLS